MRGLRVSPIGGWDREGPHRTGLGSSGPFQGHTSTPLRGLSRLLWGRSASLARHGRTPARSVTGRRGLALPLNSAWLFLPLGSLSPESQCVRASRHYLPWVKMCSHHPLSPSDEKQDGLLCLFLTSMNDAEWDPSSSSTRPPERVATTFSYTGSCFCPSVCLLHPPSPHPGATWFFWLGRPEP